MEYNYTSGPWGIKFGSESDEYIITAKGSTLFKTMHHATDGDLYLASAAPELFLSLWSLVNCPRPDSVSEDLQKDHWKKRENLYLAAYRQAIKTINKARGELI